MQDIIMKNLMAKDVMCASLETSLLEVVNTMRENTVSCMVVIEEDLPIGIITERDVVGIMATVLESPLSVQLHASDFMSTPPITLNKKATLFEALVIAQARKIRHLPIVDDKGKLAGIVTYSDLVRMQLYIIEKQREIIEHSVASRTKKLQEANKQLKALSYQDSLLGIGNRRAMEVDLDHTHNAAVRYQRPYSLVLFDVDYFKRYNDHYGHKEGDHTLQRVAGHLQSSVRKSDRLYRYGGEEILLLLPETKQNGAYILADRVVKGLAEQGIPHTASSYRILTVSAGIGYEEPTNLRMKNWQDLVEKADRGLYRAKSNGRNQVALESQAA